MKQIFSKTLNDRISKEAGLWDSIKGNAKGLYEGAKGAYNATQDFANKVQTGWQIGKDFKGKTPAQQRMQSMLYEDAFPVSADGKYMYAEDVIDPKTGITKRVPRNPYYKPGLYEKFYGQKKRHKLPRGMIINPVIGYDSQIEQQVQQALVMMEDMSDRSFFDELVRNKIIVNENDPNISQPNTPAAPGAPTAPTAGAPTNPPATPAAGPVY